MTVSVWAANLFEKQDHGHDHAADTAHEIAPRDRYRPRREPCADKPLGTIANNGDIGRRPKGRPANVVKTQRGIPCVSTGSGIRHVSRESPLLRKRDNHLLRVADLDAAISFYRDKLGHRPVSRSDETAGFALPETDAELVVHLKMGPETDIVVAEVGRAFALFLSTGGEGVQRPFDVAIGR